MTLKNYWIRAGLCTLAIPIWWATFWPNAVFLVGMVAYCVYKAVRLMRTPPVSGDHLADILVQHHPYVGWVAGATLIDGEAAAMGLVPGQRWSDEEVSYNVNGSAAVLRHSAPWNTRVDEKPVTHLVVE